MLLDFIFIANLYHHDFIYLYLISDQKISSLIDFIIKISLSPLNVMSSLGFGGYLLIYLLQFGS